MGFIIHKICASLQSLCMTTFYKPAWWNLAAVQDGFAIVDEAACVSGGFSSALTANVSSVSPAQMFIILEIP